jgi:hypothetical protein
MVCVLNHLNSALELRIIVSNDTNTLSGVFDSGWWNTEPRPQLNGDGPVNQQPYSAFLTGGRSKLSRTPTTVKMASWRCPLSVGTQWREIVNTNFLIWQVVTTWTGATHCAEGHDRLEQMWSYSTPALLIFVKAILLAQLWSEHQWTAWHSQHSITLTKREDPTFRDKIGWELLGALGQRDVILCWEGMTSSWRSLMWTGLRRFLVSVSYFYVLFS